MPDERQVLDEIDLVLLGLDLVIADIERHQRIDKNSVETMGADSMKQMSRAQHGRDAITTIKELQEKIESHRGRRSPSSAKLINTYQILNIIQYKGNQLEEKLIARVDQVEKALTLAERDAAVWKSAFDGLSDALARGALAATNIGDTKV